MREALDTEEDFLEQGMVLLVVLLVLLLQPPPALGQEENVSWVGKVRKGREHEHSRLEQVRRCSDSFFFSPRFRFVCRMLL